MNISELKDMPIEDIIERLAYYDAGVHLSFWNLDTRDYKDSIIACCEEMDNLAHRAGVIAWCQELSANGEGVGEDFHRGVQLMADEIKYRLRIVQAIILTAVRAMAEGKE